MSFATNEKRRILSYFGDIFMILKSYKNSSKTFAIIRNFLLQSKTKVEFDGVVEGFCETHNFIFFLIPFHWKVYKLNINSFKISILNLLDEQKNFAETAVSSTTIKMDFDEIRQLSDVQKATTVAATAKVNDSSLTDELEMYESSELLHLNAKEFHLKNCNIPKTNFKTKNDHLIFTVGTICYLISNKEKGSNLREIFAENNKNEAPAMNCEISEEIIKCSSGNGHALLLSSLGEVYSLGNGNHGELGRGSFDNQEIPKKIEFLSSLKIIDIACGSWHSIALSDDYNVYVWGWNNFGQLSNISSLVNIPYPLEIDDEIIAVDAYRNCTLLYTANMTVISYGSFVFHNNRI